VLQHTVPRVGPNGQGEIRDRTFENQSFRASGLSLIAAAIVSAKAAAALPAALVALGFLWLVTRKATPGVPSKTQAFVELMVEFVNDQVRSMFHHDYKIVAPIALTIC